MGGPARDSCALRAQLVGDPNAGRLHQAVHQSEVEVGEVGSYGHGGHVDGLMGKKTGEDGHHLVAPPLQSYGKTGHKGERHERPEVEEAVPGEASPCRIVEDGDGEDEAEEEDKIGEEERERHTRRSFIQDLHQDPAGTPLQSQCQSRGDDDGPDDGLGAKEGSQGIDPSAGGKIWKEQRQETAGFRDDVGILAYGEEKGRDGKPASSGQQAQRQEDEQSTLKGQGECKEVSLSVSLAAENLDPDGGPSLDAKAGQHRRQCSRGRGRHHSLPAVRSLSRSLDGYGAHRGKQESRHHREKDEQGEVVSERTQEEEEKEQGMVQDQSPYRLQKNRYTTGRLATKPPRVLCYEEEQCIAQGQPLSSEASLLHSVTRSQT
ncbi:hypothetical protein CBR_g19526 [Chara braunii]|uniref:Uncharacterized protein n=1 Tax=Chara braunii TaxID=69332 RepID=A0A388KYG1_CHABU|nr:hypothetical protein CBR_g19526 [Chara braunii]|eukprot:GBG75012.1 hypothetical protein CBR_g19526 [Chara braunii]